MKILVHVNSPYFNAGIVVDGDSIIKAAPILAKFRHLGFKGFHAYARKRNWQVSVETLKSIGSNDKSSRKLVHRNK